jgi:hypothetical protein
MQNYQAKLQWSFLFAKIMWKIDFVKLFQKANAYIKVVGLHFCWKLYTLIYSEKMSISNYANWLQLEEIKCQLLTVKFLRPIYRKLQS